MLKNIRCASWALAVLAVAGAGSASAQNGFEPAQPPDRLRLYVLDCGRLNLGANAPGAYNLTAEEVGETRLAVPCYLVAHPRGTLLWELGVVPDATVEARARGEEGDPAAFAASVAPVPRTLRSQLAALGYRPADITYVSFSHSHKDHSANANTFTESTWLLTPAERAYMWEPGNSHVSTSFYDRIGDAPAIDLKSDEYDVFGDGSAVIKAAPGHSPGHQVLVLNLQSTGKIMLGGDLYHYPAERTLHRPAPAGDFDPAQTEASRAAIERYLERTGTTLWIEHDFDHDAALRKAPAYYD